MRRLRLLTRTVAFAPLLACSTEEPQPVAAAEPPIALPKKTLEKQSVFELDNGLRVILDENHSAPIVSLQAWVRAGSADELAAGAAELTQRLLQKGSKSFANGEGERRIQTVGGTWSGYTTLDNSVVETSLASRFVELGIDVLSDALLQPQLEEADLKRELQAMRKDAAIRDQNVATQVSTLLFANAFSAHPYRRALAATETQLQKLTREQVVQHKERFWVARNLTLVVSGDIQQNPVRERIEKAFASLPSGQKAAARQAEPEAKQVAVQQTFSGQNVHLALGFHTPALDHSDTFALQLLSVVLSQGEGARLKNALVREGLASDAYSFAFAGRDPGLFTVGITTSPKQQEQVVAALNTELASLHEEVVSNAELDRAKKQLVTAELYQRESVAGAARKIGFYASVLGDPSYADRSLQRLNSVTGDELREVARRYLRADKLCAVSMTPAPQGVAVDTGSNSQPTNSLSRALISGLSERLANTTKADDVVTSPNGVARIVLPSGTVVLVNEDHRLPLVAVRAVYPGGLRYETARNNGINALIARLLTASTKRHKAAELTADLEELGARIEGFSGNNVLGVRAELTKNAFEPAFEIIGEMLTQPAFDAAELERERPELLREIRARVDNGSSQTTDLFAETLFDQSPLRLRATGTVESVSPLKADDLQKYFAAHYTRDHLVIAIVGDVRVSDVKKQAERLFGRALPRTELLAPVAEGPLTAPRHVERNITRGSSNALLGVRGLPSRHPDRPALELLSVVLTHPNGRLAKMVSSLGARLDGVFIDAPEGGYLGALLSANKDTVKTLLRAATNEWLRLSRDELSAAELDEARRYLIGQRARRVETFGGRASALALGEAYGVGHDYDASFEAKLAAITPAELLRVASGLFTEQQLVSVSLLSTK